MTPSWSSDDAISGLPLFAAACTAKAVRAGFDTGAARAAILEALGRSGRAMTGEELVDHCQRLGLVPHDARAFGSVFKKLANDKQIVAVGFAARRKGHGTAGARLWKATNNNERSTA
jgi:hypothetical protein